MIVLDCSAAVEIALNTEKGRSFRSLMVLGETVMAPELYRAEICNVAWKLKRAGLLDSSRAEIFMNQALDMVDEYVSTEDLTLEVLAESVRQDHPAYDMFYLVLARRNAATLFTSDRKLRELCEKMGLDCVHEVEV